MTTTSQPPVTRRRWFRFSLRMLFVVVTVLCVWLGFMVNAARRQREAVEAIVKAGGTVMYDYKPGEPIWGRNASGNDYFQTVYAVRFVRPFPIVDLDQVARLSELGKFRSEQEPALASLEKLSHLEILSLVGTHVTGEMLARLKCLSSLTDVHIEFCDLDDAGMEQIGKMANLKYLELIGNRITDESIPQIQKLKKLRGLTLGEAAITDVGLQQLADMKQLNGLSLPLTQQVSRSLLRDLKKSLPHTYVHSGDRQP